MSQFDALDAAVYCARVLCGSPAVGFAKRTLRNDGGARSLTSCFRIRYPAEQVWENEPQQMVICVPGQAVAQTRAQETHRPAQELGG
jgi:hypothetical protein